jgi:hypothetical protein
MIQNLSQRIEALLTQYRQAYTDWIDPHGCARQDGFAAMQQACQKIEALVEDAEDRANPQRRAFFSCCTDEKEHMREEIAHLNSVVADRNREVAMLRERMYTIQEMARGGTDD